MTIFFAKHMSFLNNAEYPPLLFVTIGLIASSAAVFAGFGWSFLVASGLVLLTALYFQQIKPLTLILVVAAIICAQWRYSTCVNQFKQMYAFTDNTACTVIGTVQADEIVEHLPLKRKLKIHSINITRNDNRSSFTQPLTILVYTQISDKIMVGDTVMIEHVTLKESKKESFARYLLKENIAAQVFAPNAQVSLLHRPSWSIKRTLDQYKKRLICGLKNKLSPETFSLFSSLFLGFSEKKKHDSAPVKKQCAAWGISHYLARSGLHLVIFILFWQLVSRLMPIHLFYKNIFILILIGFYALLTSASISFYRAFLSLVFSKLFSLAMINTSTLQVLCLVCCLVLIYNPLYLFFLDFQLSFLLTFGLILHNHLQIHKKELIA